MKPSPPVVGVVVQDGATSATIRRFLAPLGYQFIAFRSASEFLSRNSTDLPDCLLVQLQQPASSTLEFQQSLSWLDSAPPVIIFANHPDIATVVRAIRGGALDFLSEPLVEAELRAALARAVALSAVARQERHELEELRQRYRELTPREQEVFLLITEGLANKQIAKVLNTTLATVKVHRGRVMHKLGVESAVHLAQIAYRLGISCQQPTGSTSLHNTDFRMTAHP